MGVSGGVLPSRVGVRGGERVLKREDDESEGDDVLLDGVLVGMVSG